VVAVDLEVVMPLVEGEGLVDAHARGPNDAGQVALWQAQGDGNVAIWGYLSVLLGEDQ
jgi:hypothetical protein